ncbi:hypothetical protein Tco_1170637 [Tanacetum coccineum]
MSSNKAKNYIYLLQGKSAPPLHSPFHFAGMGRNPSSLKLGDSGYIPLSISPTATPGFLAIPSDSWM